METIQLQCGSCGQMMGISAAHLGSQVQCPHCQAVVQTPPPAGQLGMTGHPPAPLPNHDRVEGESIFGQTEPGDDLFGAGEAPRIEMPPMAPREMPPPPPLPPFEPTVTMEPAALPQQYPSSAHDTSAGHGTHLDHGGHAALFEERGDNDIAPIVPRNLPKRGMFVPILLIFLVPYSICTTGFIIYLLYLHRQYEHPLKMLPDPTKNGAPRIRISYNTELPSDLKVPLGETLRIGAIEVTPQAVKETPNGDLMLVVRARNVSADQIFTPVADQWLRYSGRSMTEAKPYTFLERQKADKQRIYGGNLEWVRGAGGADQFFDGELNPGEEAIVHLTTEDKYRPIVPQMVRAPERLLWRLQVRRGLVPFEGNMVSTTAVVGVEFSSSEILKSAGEG